MPGGDILAGLLDVKLRKVSKVRLLSEELIFSFAMLKFLTCACLFLLSALPTFVQAPPSTKTEPPPAAATALPAVQLRKTGSRLSGIGADSPSEQAEKSEQTAGDKVCALGVRRVVAGPVS